MKLYSPDEIDENGVPKEFNKEELDNELQYLYILEIYIINNYVLEK